MWGSKMYDLWNHHEIVIHGFMGQLKALICFIV